MPCPRWRYGVVRARARREAWLLELLRVLAPTLAVVRPVALAARARAVVARPASHRDGVLERVAVRLQETIVQLVQGLRDQARARGALHLAA